VGCNKKADSGLTSGCGMFVLEAFVKGHPEPPKLAGMGSSC